MGKLLFGIDVLFDRDSNSLRVECRIADRDGVLRHTWELDPRSQTLSPSALQDCTSWIALCATHGLLNFTGFVAPRFDESRADEDERVPLNTDQGHPSSTTWTPVRGIGHTKR